MVMLPCSSACTPVLSVTRTVNVNVPAVVGVPERTAGGDAARLSPGGSCPAAMDQMYCATPPARKKFCEEAVPTGPAGQQALGEVITSCEGGGRGRRRGGGGLGGGLGWGWGSWLVGGAWGGGSGRTQRRAGRAGLGVGVGVGAAAHWRPW